MDNDEIFRYISDKNIICLFKARFYQKELFYSIFISHTACSECFPSHIRNTPNRAQEDYTFSRSLFSLGFWAKCGVNWHTMDKTNLWNDGNPNTMAPRWETCAPLVSTLLASRVQDVFYRFHARAREDFPIKRKKKIAIIGPQRLNKFQWQAAHEWKSIEDHEREEERNFEAYNTQINQRQINHCNPHIFYD